KYRTVEDASLKVAWWLSNAAEKTWPVASTQRRLAYRKSSKGPSLVLTRSRMPPMSDTTRPTFGITASPIRRYTVPASACTHQCTLVAGVEMITASENIVISQDANCTRGATNGATASTNASSAVAKSKPVQFGGV